MAMAQEELRRSSRLHVYDSNGRDFLADRMDWSRKKLEEWIVSPSVRPHLQLWYNVCIGGPRRFNDAVAWINTGEQGYFYNPNSLEEDLLLMCLDEGDKGIELQFGLANSDGYADTKANTSNWTTQHLWARTAWRIVHANKGDGCAFEKHAGEHLSACYGFVIDLLCLAFHSIAFRGASSVYTSLIQDHFAPSSASSNEISTPNHQSNGSSTKATDSSSDGCSSDSSFDINSEDNDVQASDTSDSQEDDQKSARPL